MSKEKETLGEEEKDLEAKEEREVFCRYDCTSGSKKDVNDGNFFNNFLFASCSSPVKKIMIYETNWTSDPKWDRIFSGKGQIGSSSGVEPEDADVSFVPSLTNELEAFILARVPRSEYWKFCFVNKRFHYLLRSGELFNIRMEIGFKEWSIFMLTSGESRWLAYDQQFKSCRKLPTLPSDHCFAASDKLSVCAGSHLIVSGREIDGIVVWRYELATNKWFKGPSMINSRCLFASATCGSFAFVAGGNGMGTGSEVLSSAEIYNSESKSWEPLPGMQQRRQLCSGCYMDNKFYVIGGENEEGQHLTCGEAYDVKEKKWVLIRNMLKDTLAPKSPSPPLVAVVKNELYLLEATTNELKVYLKRSNSWKRLGPVPVRADFSKGWGVAFKSLGNELLLIGPSSVWFAGRAMAIYTCSPDPDDVELLWRFIGCGRNQLSHFISNCSVMEA